MYVESLWLPTSFNRLSRDLDNSLNEPRHYEDYKSISARIGSLQEGNVFARVCVSVHIGKRAFHCSLNLTKTGEKERCNFQSDNTHPMMAGNMKIFASACETG